MEEFFELFKTPWEMYRPGRAYDVVVATGDVLAGVNGKLLLVYGAAAKDVDARIGVCGSGLHQSALLRHRGILFPIYGELLTFANRGERVCCVTANSEAAGVEGCQAECKVVRLGYDLFDEVRFLLSTGQPIEHAEVPTLEIHIGMLREWILSAGIPFLEIPPAPAGYKCAVCLTHDIDFVGIRNHRFDHTMWGFVYRATVGAVRNVARGRLSWAHMLESWRAVASLPLVYAGWKKDFWEPFGWYLRVERGLPATYFLIPFKRRAGQKVPGRNGGRRATAYDVGDLSQWRRILMEEGCEIGVHGIDAWHSAERGREELSKVAAGTENARTGIRMHWLLRDAETPTVLERAGYAYDSTIGYNETVGYRAGTGQVFRPLGAHALLELPLHIQDGALFYRQRLDLSEPEAETRCQALIEDVCEFGVCLRCCGMTEAMPPSASGELFTCA